ncbi:hypothetical protein D3C86_1867340 [compost metagenome]
MPSGEKIGFCSTPGFVVSLLGLAPDLSEIQISPPYTKATCSALTLGLLNNKVSWASTVKAPDKAITNPKNLSLGFNIY